jgi:hypothetical protein
MTTYEDCGGIASKKLLQMVREEQKEKQYCLSI